MKLQNIQEVEEFRKVVHQCKGRVYLESLEGDIFNLKSAMSEYVALGRLLSEQGDSLELFADNKDLLNGSDEQAYAFTAAGEALAQYESTQEDVDNAVDRLENILGTETLVTEESPSADAAAESEDAIDAADDGASGEKGSPSTGVEGVAVAVAVVILAGAGIAMSKKQ